VWCILRCYYYYYYYIAVYSCLSLYCILYCFLRMSVDPEMAVKRGFNVLSLKGRRLDKEEVWALGVLAGKFAMSFLNCRSEEAARVAAKFESMEFLDFVWDRSGKNDRARDRETAKVTKGGARGKKVRCEGELVKLGGDLCQVDLGPSQLRGGRARKRPAEDDAVSVECVELMQRVKRLRGEEKAAAAAVETAAQATAPPPPPVPVRSHERGVSTCNVFISFYYTYCNFDL
jgi:hypothetical protein